MKRAGEKKSNKLGFVIAAFAAVVVVVVGFLFFNPFGGKASNTAKKTGTSGSSSSTQAVKYEPSQEEKDYLKNRFAQLTSVNPEAIAYVYAPGTELDEPVVQTGDNATYLDKTFDGGLVMLVVVRLVIIVCLTMSTTMTNKITLINTRMLSLRHLSASIIMKLCAWSLFLKQLLSIVLALRTTKTLRLS